MLALIISRYQKHNFFSINSIHEYMVDSSERELELNVEKIIAINNLPYFQKINALTCLFEEFQKNSGNRSSSSVEKLENAIEDQFGVELRRLNALREKNLECVKKEDIEELKNGYKQLFDSIETTFHWSSSRHESMYGVINRASLRAMMIDPEVSVRTKQEIMDRWEEFM
jgi:hypothetical protein